MNWGVVEVCRPICYRFLCQGHGQKESLVIERDVGDGT
jgi:hypothetical protein